MINLVAMAWLLLVNLSLITVHGPDGDQEITINVAEITSIRQPREGAQGHFAPGTNCLIYMTNGNFIATNETCLEVIHLIATHKE